MDDLVEKLRRRAKQNPTPGGLLVMVDPGTLNDAADEIERLRTLETKLLSAHQTKMPGEWSSGWDAAIAWLLAP